jgi:hypothetical protein
MGMRAPESVPEPPPPVPRTPPLAQFAGLALVLFVALVSNGRPIGAGDTRPSERAAASFVQEGDLDLDEYPEVEPPFARSEKSHRVSIYPVLSAVLAAPVFALARTLFVLDETGTALAGKVAAALFSALAASVLFVALSRRHPTDEAGWAAAVFALGTTVWSTSQALWQHPAAILFLSLAVLFALKAEDDAAWAGRAGAPLSLAVAARHADVALVAALAIGLAARWPRRLPSLVLWSLPAAAFLMAYNWTYFGSPLRHGFSGSLDARFAEPWGVGHLGLLVSPAKGLLVFTPVVVVAAIGLVRRFRHGDSWLAGTLAAGVLAHWLLMGRWTDWHGGESWGPRLMSDALPFLFLFLPDGWSVVRGLGTVLAVFSVAVQAMGAFAYDYQWERTHQRPPAAGRPELWRVAQSPILFYAERRNAIFAMPAVRGGRAFVREHPVVLLGAKGSRVTFSGRGPAIEGSERTLGDVQLLRGARVEGDTARLAGRWDGVFLRVQPQARQRRLELRIAGRGRGILYVGEKTFWSETPRWTEYAMAGSFRLRHPYYFPESGGGDLTVTLGRAGGQAELQSIALVPPGDPEDAIRLPR